MFKVVNKNKFRLVILILVLLTIPLIIYLVQHLQIFKGRAGGSSIEFFGTNIVDLQNGQKGFTLNNQGQPAVSLRLTSPFGPPNSGNISSPIPGGSGGNNMNKKEIKLAVILAKFQDDTSNPYAKTDVQSMIFYSPISVKKYYVESSFGQFTFSGDVFGWYTIPGNTNYCSPETWATAAEQVARNQGIDLSNYSNEFFIFPTNTCQGIEQGAVIGPIGSPKAWSKILDFPLIVHELGHSFGLAHATALKCGDLAIDDYSKCSDVNLTQFQYGDPGDVMGGSDKLANTP